jgi:hypothetical protein
VCPPTGDPFRQRRFCPRVAGPRWRWAAVACGTPERPGVPSGRARRDVMACGAPERPGVSAGRTRRDVVACAAPERPGASGDPNGAGSCGVRGAGGRGKPAAEPGAAARIAHTGCLRGKAGDRCRGSKRIAHSLGPLMERGGYLPRGRVDHPRPANHHREREKPSLREPPAVIESPVARGRAHEVGSTSLPSSAHGDGSHSSATNARRKRRSCGRCLTAGGGCATSRTPRPTKATNI